MKAGEGAVIWIPRDGRAAGKGGSCWRPPQRGAGCGWCLAHIPRVWGTHHSLPGSSLSPLGTLRPQGHSWGGRTVGTERKIPGPWAVCTTGTGSRLGSSVVAVKEILRPGTSVCLSSCAHFLPWIFSLCGFLMPLSHCGLRFLFGCVASHTGFPGRAFTAGRSLIGRTQLATLAVGSPLGWGPSNSNGHCHTSGLCCGGRSHAQRLPLGCQQGRTTPLNGHPGFLGLSALCLFLCGAPPPSHQP